MKLNYFSDVSLIFNILLQYPDGLLILAWFLQLSWQNQAPALLHSCKICDGPSVASLTQTYNSPDGQSQHHMLDFPYVASSNSLCKLYIVWRCITMFKNHTS
jgi:hypothetical protein